MRIRGWPGPGVVTVLWLWPAMLAAAQSRLPLPPDELRNVIAAAETATAAGNFSEAVERWQSLIDAPEDYFDVDRRSVRSRAEDALFALPAAGRSAYERRFGATARTLLGEALELRDQDRLDEVVRRFFWTDAGREAAAVLAQRLMDDGQPLAAARVYDRLVRHTALSDAERSVVLTRAAVCWWLAGSYDAAQERLAARDRAPAARSLNAAETGIDLPAGAAGLERLSQQVPLPLPGAEPTLDWALMFRGSPGRNGRSAAAAAVGPVAWARPSIDRHDSLHAERIAELERRVEALQQRYSAGSEERVLLPAGVPVVARGVVVFRGPGSIKAVSLETGELLWSSVHIDDTFHHLVDQEWQRREEEWHSAYVDLFLVQRMWRDLTAASLSTDGRLVYAVADGGMVSSISQSAVNLPALSEHPLAPHPFNRLLAIDLRSGLMAWELGGPPVPFEKSLAGAYFLGAPLPLDGRLYCLVEDRGQVQLVVLDPATSAVEWSQALYNPDVNFSNVWLGTARRMAGLSPSASGDVLICPTGETTVVAVDRRRRTLLWSREYQQPVVESPQQALAIRMLMARQQPRGRIEDQLAEDLLQGDHWADCAPVVAGESVLLTPPDSHDLCCLRLLDGEEVWRRARGSRLFIAAVHDGNVILVSPDQVEAVRLSDGSAGWPAALPISAPGGRGFRHDHWYVLPLARGDVATIDLRDGKLVARSPLPEGARAGNLVAADGRIVCQTAYGVQAFHSLQELNERVASRLAARADDAQALYERGQMSLHLGERTAALQDLRAAVAADPDSPARHLLAATLIEGLRTDFAAYRPAAPEIERLATGVAEQALFHRLYAEGLQRSGEVEAAFQQYLRFADHIGSLSELQKLDGARSVRGDRWIRGRLEELLESAGTDEAVRLRDELARAVDAVVAARDVDGLLRLQRVVPDRDQQTRIERSLVRLLNDFTPQVEALLLRLLERGASEDLAYATARLVDGWLSANRPSRLLERLLADLEGPLASAECLHGAPGAELVAEWRGDPQRAALIDAPQPWPTRHVAAADEPRTLPGPMIPVRHLGPRSELLSGWTFFTDSAGENLAIFDRLGRLFGQVPTGVSGSIRGRRGPNYVRYITTSGRYLLLVVEDQWMLVDVFGSERGPALLGSQRLTHDTGGIEMPPGNPRLNLPGRIRMRVWIDPQGGVRPLGNVSPIADGMFVYQAGNRLTAVSAHSGEPLWTHDVPGLLPGAEIMVDGRHVLLWPSDSTELRLFRAADGSALGKVRLPPHVHLPQPDGTWGTRLVTLNRGQDGSLFELGLFDPLTESRVWQRSLPPPADWGVVDGRDFYVLQRDGRLLVIDGRSGEDLVDVQLPAEPPPEQTTVWKDDARWYIATYRSPPPERELFDTVQPLQPIVHGMVLALSRTTGEVLWSVPVEYQQLHAELPGAWPFLTFAAPRTEPGRGAGRYWSLLLIEKRTGRVLYEATSLGRQDRQGWLSDPDKQLIHLAFGSIRTRLEFHDSPPEPETPE